ncbi:MAG: telomere maintenance SDE2 family protein [Nitrospirota bacterium]|nr:telomere maintenance SDE2 family protein [Nitrospirota bacterium]
MGEFQLRRMSSARTGDDDPGGKCECIDCERLRTDVKAQNRMLARYLKQAAAPPGHRKTEGAP